LALLPLGKTNDASSSFQRIKMLLGVPITPPRHLAAEQMDWQEAHELTNPSVALFRL